MSDFTRKRKYIIMTISLAVLLVFALLIWFSGSYFGSGISDHEDNDIEAPEFSAESGFYQDSFDLTLKADGETTIYYTLDGSEPDESSTVYDGPIHLTNATSNKNVYSMRKDTSTGFYEDLIEKYSGLSAAEAAPGYKAPEYKVDKCNVVRAVAIDSMGRTSEITTGTYFVGIDPDRYDQANIISVVTDPDNLFDYEDGIYVTGAKFNKYAQTDAIKDYHGLRWRYWSANYTQHGKDWERDASLDFFDSEGALIESKETGLRTHGGCSRGVLPKSLKFYARSKYDGTDSFSTGLFDDDYAASKLLLSGGGSEPLVQCCDYMMSTLLADSDVNFATMKFQPYVLFLDGEYWGYYWLETNYDSRYCSYYYGVDEDNVLMIKEGEVCDGEDTYKSLYTDMRDTIKNSDMTQNDNYKEACSLIDMDSYIDYYATQIYIARGGDWPSSNYQLWRTVNTKSDKYSDGKWRWMLFDSDSQGLKESLVSDDTLGYVLQEDAVFASLWKNDDFRQQFQKRIFQIADQCFNEEKVDQFFSDFQEVMDGRMAKSWKRFYGNDTSKEKEYYEGKLTSYHNFFRQRRDVVASWFE